MDYTGKIISKNPPQPTQASASGVWTLDEAAAAVKNNSWPIPGVPNPISKSLRFNSADSAYLSRTPSSTTNQKTWTFSAWVKRSKLGETTRLFTSVLGSGSRYTEIDFLSGDTIQIFSGLYTTGGSTTTSVQLITTQVFRDVSAWYHIVVAMDTTQATAANRTKLYVNGTQVTAFGTETYPAQNDNLFVNVASLVHEIGAQSAGTFFNGYMTEINFIDGSALTPSSFGQTNANTGVWEPKPYTGTYGTNGFYLNFKDSATTTALGYDYSGNGNNWTPNNFSVTAGAGNDSLVDVPTQWIGYNTSGDTGGIWRGNYCTWNPLNIAGGALANGNLDLTNTAGGRKVGTIAVSSGKWYWEVAITSAGSGMVGLMSPANVVSTGAGTNFVGGAANEYGYYTDNGQKYTNGTAASYGATYGSGDVIGVALNLDAGEITFYKNGSSQGVAFTGVSGTLAPAASAGGSSGASMTANFGQRPFAYTPPAGFVSLCTTNLPTPTIGATSTTQAGKYFNPVLYTGDGANPRTITGVGFQPDFVWTKSRSNSSNNSLVDSVRGGTKLLISELTDSEYTGTWINSFNSDGYVLGTNSTTSNANGYTYVAWNWKANGAGSSNTAGSISSTVSVNTTAGFSIVTYTGNATSGATVGHGLGVAPSMIILKIRGSTGDWPVYHTSVGNQRVLFLNLNLAQSGITSGPWNSTSPTSTVFTLGNAVETNPSNTMVAYCFAPVASYSSFGSYTGNGSSDGPFVYTGFRPRYVLIKHSNDANSWFIWDSVRNTYNAANATLKPNSSDAEETSYSIDVLSNGFKIRTSDVRQNTNAGTYIYAAFAESPFKYSLAR